MARDKDAIYLELLIYRCKDNDKAAFEELISLWEKRLFYFIRRLSQNEQDAWDVLQQVWIKLISGIEYLRNPASFPCWIYRIAYYTVVSHNRKLFNHKNVFQTIPDGASDAETEISCAEFDNAEQVHNALTRLSIPHREVLTLFFLEDFSIEEIAKILGIPQGTVKSRMYYAKKELKKTLIIGK